MEADADRCAVKFDLRRPCADCPFRHDIPGYLTAGRAKEIATALLGDATFTCHKTNEFTNEGTVETPNSQHCAGALIFLERQDRPNQMMRWMERLGGYDYRLLDSSAPVFDSAEAFVLHHGRRRS